MNVRAMNDKVSSDSTDDTAVLPVLRQWRAIFARVNGTWRFEGFQHDKNKIAFIKKVVEEENGEGSFYSQPLPDHADKVAQHQTGFVLDRI